MQGEQRHSSEANESTSTLQSASIPEEISEPEVEKFPVVIYPNMTVKPDSKLAEVLKPVEEFGRFYATYLF